MSPDNTHEPASDASPGQEAHPQIELLLERLQRTQNPEERALLTERIVLVALPLADALARRYSRKGIEDDDLVQVARTALVGAIGRYQVGLGNGFWAFATPSICGEIKRWFRDHGWSVRPPRRLQELRAAVVAEEETMRHRLGRDPSDAELASALSVAEADVTEARMCSSRYHAVSLDAPTSAGTSIAEQILVQPDQCDTIATRDALEDVLTHLTARQQLVLHLRYVDELTQSQIGEHIGVSQMQVSRILRQTLTTLRAELAGGTATAKEETAA